jgi:hypothetical protein
MNLRFLMKHFYINERNEIFSIYYIDLIFLISININLILLNKKFLILLILLNKKLSSKRKKIL